MSFSSLPTELLYQITLFTTITSTFASTTYKQRQATLRNLCLVSHRFRSIAQPLLRETVAFKLYELPARPLELLVTNAWAQDVREVKVKILNGKNRSTMTTLLEVLVTNCPNLRMLDLSTSANETETDLHILSRLPSMSATIRERDFADIHCLRLQDSRPSQYTL